VKVGHLNVGIGVRKGLPWLVLSAALILATMPAWRPLIYGTTLTLDDLLNMRCLPG
jgi:hypothetical protein